MPLHWLDSNVFIQAKNGPYSFSLAPTFWSWLIDASANDLIRSPQAVHAELLRHKDALSRWAQLHRSSGLFVNPEPSVLKCYGQIATFVQNHYDAAHSKKFLSGADPWIVAHAMADRGTVVTHELLANPGSREVKIPNVCAELSVKYLRAYEAFEKLGLKL